MAIQEVITIYKSQVDEYVKGIDDILVKLKKLDTEEDKQGDEASKQFTKQKTASQQRKQLLDSEIANLKKFQQQSKSAFTVPEIEKFNTQISKSQKNIALLKGEGDGLNKLTSGLKGQFVALGAGIAAAFSIQAIIAFGKESVNAFFEAEKAAQALKFAIVDIGGEGEKAFEKLIAQSKELEAITIFSDDSIQKAQAVLATFGLTSDQISELTPKLADFATITNQSIDQAASSIGQGLQGMGREFKKLGIDVSANNTELENFNIILEGFSRRSGAAEAAAKTLAGQLQQQQNAANNLQESIGEKLAPALVKLKVLSLEAAESLINLFSASGARENALDAQGFTREQIKLLQELGFAANSSGEQIKKEGLAIIEANLQFSNLNEQLRLGNITQKEFNEFGEVFINQTKESNNSIETKAILLGLINKALRDNVTEQKKSSEEDARIIKSTDLRSKSLQELNKILAENKKVNDIISQSNVKLIEREIEARKKAGEEGVKVRAKALEDEKKIVEQINKLKIELATTEEEKISLQVQFDQQAAQKAVEDKRTLDQVLVDTERQRSALFVFIKQKELNDLLALDKKKEAKDKESLLRLFVEDQNTILNELDLTEAERDKKRTDLKQFELTQQVKNLKDSLQDSAAAEAELSKFLIELDSRTQAERIRIKSETQDRLDQQRLNQFADGSSAQLNEENNIAQEQAERKLKIIQKELNSETISAEDAANKIFQVNEELADKLEANNTTIANNFIDTFSKISAAASEIFSSIAEIYRNNSQEEVELLEMRRDFQLAAYDEDLEALQSQRDKKLISQKTFEAKAKIIEEEKIKTEKAINAKINAEKRKQAELERSLKIFEILINAASAILKITSQTGIFAPPFIALQGIITAAQIAAVLSAPLPKFALGTKGKQDSGMAIVGEQGEEAVFLPQGSKVIPADKTKKHAQIFDAIYDNQLEGFIKEKYIAPALIAQQRNYDTKKQQNFAENIANSFMLQNSVTGLDEHGMRKALNSGTRIRNTDEIGKAIAKHLNAIDLRRM